MLADRIEEASKRVTPKELSKLDQPFTRIIYTVLEYEFIINKI